MASSRLKIVLSDNRLQCTPPLPACCRLSSTLQLLLRPLWLAFLRFPFSPNSTFRCVPVLEPLLSYVTIAPSGPLPSPRLESRTLVNLHLGRSCHQSTQPAPILCAFHPHSTRYALDAVLDDTLMVHSAPLPGTQLAHHLAEFTPTALLSNSISGLRFTNALSLNCRHLYPDPLRPNVRAVRLRPARVAVGVLAFHAFKQFQKIMSLCLSRISLVSRRAVWGLTQEEMHALRGSVPGQFCSERLTIPSMKWLFIFRPAVIGVSRLFFYGSSEAESLS